MAYIKPPSDSDDFSNWNISLKDFITIFREDDASEKLIRILNEEINAKLR